MLAPAMGDPKAPRSRQLLRSKVADSTVLIDRNRRPRGAVAPSVEYRQAGGVTRTGDSAGRAIGVGLRVYICLVAVWSESAHPWRESMSDQTRHLSLFEEDYLLRELGPVAHVPRSP